MASPSVTAPTVTAAPGSVEQLIADEHAQVRAHSSIVGGRAMGYAAMSNYDTPHLRARR